MGAIFFAPPDPCQNKRRYLSRGLRYCDYVDIIQCAMSYKISLRPKSLPFAIGLFLFSVYLLSFSGRFHVMDELAVFTAGHNLARFGRADINQLIWTNHWTPNPPGVWGTDGNLYTKKPPGISFIAAPLIGLGHAVPGLNAVHVALLTNALVTALTASLLFIWLADLGHSRPTATLTSLGYGLCTIAWVYARMFWESSLLALVFLVVAWSVYRANYLAAPRRRWLWLLLCGTATAIGLTLRFEAALIVVFIGLYLIVSQRTSRAVDKQRGRLKNEGSPHPRFSVSPLIHFLLIYLLPSLIIGLGLLYFNFTRYGSLGETGYSQEILFRRPWVGAFGLLLSPGRGLFIYAPLTLLLFFGLRPAWRRLPRPYFWLVVTICLGYWLFYGSWFAWGGTWGWGPRFLLPILPLLMGFVAEPLGWLLGQAQGGLRTKFLWLGLGALVVLSLVINFLGVAVDFNEHFRRLDSNGNFVFNWAEFPPLAHWRILREGLVDLIWLRPHAEGLGIDWAVLLPALILFAFSMVGLIVTYRGHKQAENEVADSPTLSGDKIRPAQASRYALYAFAVVVAVSLTWLMMLGSARAPLTGDQARSDLGVLDALANSAQSEDALLVPMPPFGDTQEFSTLLMAYLEAPLPIYAWIESGPRAIQPEERERIQQAVEAEARRVWLFERWLTPNDPTTLTATGLNQEAFPVSERWFAQSGRLGLYALPANSQPSSPITPLNVPFQGGLTLIDAAVWAETLTFEPGDTVKLRLTWQATTANELPPPAIPAGAITAFAQLLDQATPAQNVVQKDRLLVDLQDLSQSPLRPGETVQQGYGLELPDDLASGSYSLIVGLYHTQTGQRLPRADASPDDFVYVTNIQVK
jgi:hypothetical protein